MLERAATGLCCSSPISAGLDWATGSDSIAGWHPLETDEEKHAVFPEGHGPVAHRRADDTPPVLDLHVGDGAAHRRGAAPLSRRRAQLRRHELDLAGIALHRRAA